MAILTGELRQLTIQTERFLLGAILINSTEKSTEAIDYCRSKLLPEHFYDIEHRRIYEAMLRCERPNQIETARALNNHGQLTTNDIAYLSGLIAECPCSLAYDDFCESILQNSTERNTGQPLKLKKVIAL